MIKYSTIETPLGKLLLAEYDSKLCLLEFPDKGVGDRLAPIERYYSDKSEEKSSPVLRESESQLAAYFAGKLRNSIYRY
jgi:O6-methylguanine-DNA--protein-cysteine methyltransferase